MIKQLTEGQNPRFIIQLTIIKLLIRLIKI